MNLLTAAELEQGFYIRRSYTEVLMLVAAERDVYAIIKAFTENGEHKAYIGSPKYLSALTCRARSTINTALRGLILRGLIKRKKIYLDNTEKYALVANIALEKSLIDEYITGAKERSAQACEDEGLTGTDPFDEDGAICEPLPTAMPGGAKSGASAQEVRTSEPERAGGGTHGGAKATERADSDYQGEGSSRFASNGQGEGGGRAMGEGWQAQNNRRNEYSQPKSRSGCYISPEDARLAMQLAFARSYGEEI